MRWRSGFVDWVRRNSTGVALGIWLVCLLLFVASMTLNILIVLGHAPGGRLDFLDLYYEPGFFVLATFGALIVARRPDQVMGWLFCGSGLLAMLSWPPMAYEQFAGAERLPLLVWALWIGNAVGVAHLLIVLMIVPYLFPDGRLISRRWRPLLALAVVTIVVFTLGGAVTIRQIGTDSRQEDVNPVYISAMASMTDVLKPLAFVAIPLSLLGSISALGLRYRRARGVERLQLRWLLWMLGLIITLVLVFLAGQTAAPSLIDTTDSTWTVPELVVGLSILFGVSFGIPTVLGLAILRHRLYSIDRLINRTLVYGALSLGLGAVYVGGVVLLQQLLNPLTPSSDLAVAGSTLAVAALFQPLRRGIQRLVDRHFYRRKYDAAKTIDAFSAQLQDAVDLETLLADLRIVVQETMQPASVSLWVREQSRQERGGDSGVSLAQH